MAIAMSAVLGTITTGLRSALTTPVEKYWRAEPPKALTVFVVPKEEPEEVSEGIGGLWGSGLDVDVIVENPWADKEADGTATSVAVEAVKTYVAANRSLVAGYVLRHGAITYNYVQRPGAGKLAFLAIVPLSLRLPKNLR